VIVYFLATFGSSVGTIDALELQVLYYWMT